MTKSDEKNPETLSPSQPDDQNTVQRAPPDPDHFCYYPFMQLLLQPTGVVSPCCWNQEIVLGVVPQETLADIWNGDTLRKLRKEFLEGKPVSCKKQIRHIKCHMWSRRDYSHQIALTEIQEKGPKRLDVRLNGKCNLQCVMCEVWKQPNGLYNQSDFWTEGPKTIFPYLKEVDVLGGEPFIQPDTFRLIDEVAAINKECTWAFVTNGNYKFATSIRSRLDKIRIRWLQISVDSINPQTYSKIRIRGDLKKVLQTIEDLGRYREERALAGRPFEFTLSMCVQKQNWNEIGEFLEFGRQKKVKTILQFAYQPDTESLLYLNAEKRREIAQYMAGLVEIYGGEIVNSVYLPVLDSLEQAAPSNNQSKDATP